MIPAPKEILDTWFGEDQESAEAVAARSAIWFGGQPSFDEQLRERFEILPAQALQGDLSHWGQSPPSILALVLVLDQFPRNLYRGKEEAFAYDPVALKVATIAREAGLDAQLTPLEAVFLYLPFEHAEDAPMQEQSVILFRELLGRAPSALLGQFESFLSYAIRHQEVIDRFGRFPHRNRILQRASTLEEIDYLKAGGESF
jgi:uncharacterized protein (DUF924 family)